VGEVRLPSLVREVGLEADVGAARSLVRLRGDEACPSEGAGDRRSRDVHAEVVGDVPADRLGAGVVTGGDETPTELDDPLEDLWRGRPRRGRRTA
jgi:hypothetical protein